MSLPATDDPFATLGLPHTFRLDPARLRAVHVRLMAGASGPRELAGRGCRVARRAAAINEAQRRLADPLGRAEALLGVLYGPGGSFPEAAAPLPPDFLMEAMELRETLDEAIGLGDDVRIAALLDDAATRRDAEIESLADLFDRAFAAQGADRESEIASVCAAVNRLRYVLRLIGRVADSAREASEAEG